MTWTGTPSIWIVWPTLSRVVPGVAVTIASSAPASALSSELLPTFGWPARTTRMPSRSSAPWRARASTASTRAGRARQPAAGIGGREEVDLLVGEVERRLDQRAQLDQRFGQRLDLVRKCAVERARRRARGRLGAGVDQVGDGLGLRQVELVVEKRALGELARPGDAQGGQDGRSVAAVDRRRGFETAREQQLQHDRTAVRLQLEHVLSGVRMRRRKEDRQAVVDRRSGSVAKR